MLSSFWPGYSKLVFSSLLTGMEDNLLSFFHICQNLKTTKRTGWIHNHIKSPESISDHMYRMSIMALLITDSSLNREKCIKMALVHDLAESIVGDYTPNCKITPEEKRIKEESAMKGFCEMLGNTLEALEMLTLWKEYEEGKTGEALLVKDLDKFEMIMQAYEYEQSEGLMLESFFSSTRGKFRHPKVIALVEQLEAKRRKKE